VSAQWPDADFERDLRRLLRVVRKASREGLKVQTGDAVVGPSERIIRMGRGSLVVIRDDAFPLLRSLQSRLTGAARRRSGFSPDEAQAVLVNACEEAVDARVTDAVETVLNTLGERPEKWTITEPVDIWLSVRRLVVGRTTYSTQLPRGAASDPLVVEELATPVASATVISRGSTTARVLARQSIAESAAILDVVGPPGNTKSGATLYRRGSHGTPSLGAHHAGWFLREDMIAGTRLAPPYLYLSRAAARDEAQRSDWQRRVLAAARWFSRAHRSEWPADRLVSAMVALESLFIESRKESGAKGALIAERVTNRYQRRDMSEGEQTAWLERLYRVRNEAAHEGREVVDDLEVDRLLDLTRFIVRISAIHLDPAHRHPRRACRTYGDAMRCRGTKKPSSA
jgi:Apea-like HEPN